MAQHKEKDNDKDNEKWGALILAIILLFAGGALFLKPSLIKNNSELSSIRQEQIIDQSIDRNLKAADIRRQLESLKVQIENEKAERLREFESATEPNSVGNLKLQQESHAESVVQGLESYQDLGDEGYLDPSDVVERRIARDQVLSDYNNKYTKEYIRAFLRDARKAGLVVELNENLEVVDMREIPLDKPMRFPNSVGGQGGGAQ